MTSSVDLLLAIPADAVDSARRPPSGVLELPAPSPLELLADLSLQPRTVNSLRRFVAAEAIEGAWTVARLLAIPGFGLAALADAVHAARSMTADHNPIPDELRLEDEIAPLLSARPNLAPDVATPLLERAMALLSAILPATADEALRRLREAELTRGTLSVADLERAARFLRGGASFASVRREGFVLLVAGDQRGTAERAHRVASRLVSRWGAITLELVAHQLQTTDTDLIRAVVSARPDFFWLDRRRGWFWFGARNSPLARAIERLVTSGSPCSIEGLRLALARGRSPETIPSAGAIRAICVQLPGLRVDGDRVWPMPVGMKTLGLVGA